MKPVVHTQEWLCWIRDRAGLTRKEMAEITGVSPSTIDAVELGKRTASPEMWAKLDEALYRLMPAAYVDMEGLAERARKQAESTSGHDKCRLYYTAASNGAVTFTNLLSENDESLSDAYIIVTWLEAAALLEAQKSSLE